MKFKAQLLALAAAVSMATQSFAESPETWMVIPDKKVVTLDSAKPGPVDPRIAKPLWGAPWVHVDGTLRGTPASPEDQAKKKSHNGANPRLIFVATPSEYFAQFSIRFIGGEQSGDKGLPLIDLGHHVCALILGGDKGAMLTINRHSLLVAKDKDFKLENGATYHFQIEVKGAETLIRITGGPTLYAKNEFLEGKKRTIGLAGSPQSTIEIDDLSIWSVKDGLHENWAKRREKLPAFSLVQLKEPPAKKKKARKSKTQAKKPKNQDASSESKPNIVLIYADDLGYGDVSIYNQNSQVQTPNIDRLAKQGLRFTDAHSPHATCTGSRYGLLTGTSPARSGVKNTVLRYGPAIDSDEMTIADFLRDQGYATNMVGKWHLGLVRSGKDPSNRFLGTPEDSGFEYAVVAEGSSDLNEIRSRNRVLCNEAVRIIKEHGSSKQDKRLFLYYAPHEPHNPAVPEEPFVGRSKAGPYGDYVAQLDQWVGRVMKALDESTLVGNTLVIFASDNKAQLKYTANYPAHSPNGIFSGGKAHPEEGGHRTPFVARWPGVIPASAVSSALINQTDFFATLAELFKVDLAERYPGGVKDSFSFLPVLKNPSARHDRPPMVVVGSYRKKNWKIIVDGKWWIAKTGGELKLKALFDLEKDPSEKKNLLSEHSQVGEELFAGYKQFIDTRQQKPHALQSNSKKRK